MDVWFSPTRNTAVVRPEGDLDLTTAGPLRHALLRAHDAQSLIVADFARVEFVDSTTVGLLIAARKRAETANKRFLVAHAQGPALRVFRLLGVHALLVEPQHPVVHQVHISAPQHQPVAQLQS
jgi:anti-sigma B factor antagonist